MNVRRLLFGLELGLVILCVSAAQFASAQDDSAVSREIDPQAWALSIEERLLSIEDALRSIQEYPKTPESLSDLKQKPPTRAIVAARLIDDKPDGEGVWKGRLISMDSSVSAASEYVRHVDPGAKLLLVNLCDEPVKFRFHQAILEEGYVFEVPADGIIAVTVKSGVVVTEDDDERFFVVSSETYFTGLPGPLVLIP